MQFGTQFSVLDELLLLSLYQVLATELPDWFQSYYNMQIADALQ